MEDNSLQDWAKKIRIESLKMIHKSPAGHPGGTLSVADIIATLYFSELNIDSAIPRWPGRDRLILSKGHACAALYTALGLKGFFDVAEFDKFRRLDGLLEGHPTPRIPGVDAVSGSLGMGLSQGLGMALGARYSKMNYRVYVILGDGDMQEGATWEALMAAGHFKLDNFCAILDYNKLQQDGKVEDTLNYAPVVDKVKSFNWWTEEIDGHNCLEIKGALEKARAQKGQPTFIIAHTVKGKGVSFMEDQVNWHGSVPVSKEAVDAALQEIEGGNL